MRRQTYVYVDAFNAQHLALVIGVLVVDAHQVTPGDTKSLTEDRLLHLTLHQRRHVHAFVEQVVLRHNNNG